MDGDPHTKQCEVLSLARWNSSGSLSSVFPRVIPRERRHADPRKTIDERERDSRSVFVIVSPWKSAMSSRLIATRRDFCARSAAFRLDDLDTAARFGKDVEPGRESLSTGGKLSRSVRNRLRNRRWAHLLFFSTPFTLVRARRCSCPDCSRSDFVSLRGLAAPRLDYFRLATWNAEVLERWWNSSCSVRSGGRLLLSLEEWHFNRRSCVWFCQIR